jgi:DNA mismatch repair ATPase MutL
MVTHVSAIMGRPLAAEQFALFVEHAVRRTGMHGRVPDLRDPGWMPQAVHTVLQSLACRQAIMFGDDLSQPAMAALLRSLSLTTLPFHCAHGRLTSMLLGSADDVQRMSAGRRRQSRRQARTLRELRSRLQKTLNA